MTDMEKNHLHPSRHPIDSDELQSINALTRHFLQFNFRTDQQGCLIRGGKEFLDYLGYSETTLNPPNLFSIIHPADVQYFRTILKNVSKNRLIQNVHFRLKDNQEQWHFFSANSLITNQSPLEINFLVQDLTEERNEKQNLVLALETYKQLIEKSRDIIFQADIFTRTLTYISPSIFNKTGFEPTELEELPLEDLATIFIHPDDRSRFIQIFAVAPDNLEMHFAQTNSCIFRMRHRNGQIFRFDCLYFPVRNSKSEIVSIQGYLHDITQTEQLKYVLDESQENYRNIVENTQSLFAILDPRGNFKFASGQWKKFLEYFPEDSGPEFNHSPHSYRRSGIVHANNREAGSRVHKLFRDQISSGCRKWRYFLATCKFGFPGE